eukprot:4989241-Alexandrium_andersonii.AAC.1
MVVAVMMMMMMKVMVHLAADRPHSARLGTPCKSHDGTPTSDSLSTCPLARRRVPDRFSSMQARSRHSASLEARQ